jgi:hypothetical protein
LISTPKSLSSVFIIGEGNDPKAEVIEEGKKSGKVADPKAKDKNGDRGKDESLSPFIGNGFFLPNFHRGNLAP